VPEGDTIHRTAVALRAALLGKPTTAFQAPRVVGLVPSPGSVIERVDSRGKHLEIGWDDGCVLHTHMRMSGSWHLYRPGERWRKSSKQMRVVIEVPGWQAVCFSAPVVETFRAGEFTRHPGLGSLGPDLCKADADLAECVRRIGVFCDAETTVADALLDQRVTCGVGNVYKSEVLWACELHPFTPVGALDEGQRTRLVEVAARLLRANLEGPNRITTVATSEGLAVYGRFGKPCLRCGTPIDVRKHGEQARVTYWCPSCQVFLAPPEPKPDVEPEEPVATAPPPRRSWLRRRRDGKGVESRPDPGKEASGGDDTDLASIDPHPAARVFERRRPARARLAPRFVDPLLARDGFAP
jgi:endonuclease-8